MIGAILTTAAFAFLASTLTTIGNFAIARDFPHYQSDQGEMIFYSPLAIRFMQYRDHDEPLLLSVIDPLGRFSSCWSPLKWCRASEASAAPGRSAARRGRRSVVN